jgi:two-component system phosphate regulon sensor histidine kinase PhoR
MVVGQLLFVDRGLGERLLDLKKDEIRREIDLAASLLQTLETGDPDSIAQLLGSKLGYTVTLLDREGRVLGASSDLPSQLRGVSIPLDREELKAALVGETGFAQRRGSGGDGIRLFMAAPVVLGDADLILRVTLPLDEVLGVVRARTRQSLGLVFAALLSALALAVFLGRSLGRPLKAFSRRARALSEGTFSREIPPTPRTGELRELAEAFNGMTEELATRFNGMESERDEMQALIDCIGEAVVSLTDDGRVLRANQAAQDLLELPRPFDPDLVRVLVRKAALRSLLEGAVATPFSSKEVSLEGRNLLASSRAVEGGGAVVTFVDVTEIRRVETVRRDFVANASHELKTPLTAMRGFAETLLEDDVPEGLRKEWLNSISSHTLRLQRLVDDLLDLSRLESGGWIARKEIVDLGPLIEDVFADHSSLAGDRNISLTSEGEFLVLADEQGLEQVIKNLVENSIRYSPPGGKVVVTISGEEGSGRVAIKDDGPGIPASALPRIFERFYRVDPARSRREGGTGLGLAIVRHLVNAMGGEVWAESKMGQGTTVTFILPGAKVDEAEGLEVEGWG